MRIPIGHDCQRVDQRPKSVGHRRECRRDRSGRGGRSGGRIERTWGHAHTVVANGQQRRVAGIARRRVRFDRHPAETPRRRRRSVPPARRVARRPRARHRRRSREGGIPPRRLGDTASGVASTVPSCRRSRRFATDRASWSTALRREGPEMACSTRNSARMLAMVSVSAGSARHSSRVGSSALSIRLSPRMPCRPQSASRSSSLLTRRRAFRGPARPSRLRRRLVRGHHPRYR